MFPAFEILGFKFVSFSFFPTVGQWLAVLVFCLRARKYHLSQAMTLVFGALFLLLLPRASNWMYRLAYLPNSLEYTEGADSWGVFLMFPFLVYLFARVFKKDYVTLLNCFTPGLLVTFIFAQIGCFGNGCCVGIWIGEFQIPVQVLEACCCFCCMMYLLYRDQQCDDNNLYVLTLVIHGAYRFLADFVRASEKDLLFSRGQWLALVSLVVGLVLLYRKRALVYEKQ